MKSYKLKNEIILPTFLLFAFIKVTDGLNTLNTTIYMLNEIYIIFLIPPY